MIREYGFEDAAQIQGRSDVPTVKQGGYLQAAQIDEVEKFLRAPAGWSAAHGGVSSFPSA